MGLLTMNCNKEKMTLKCMKLLMIWYKMSIKTFGVLI